MKLKPSQITESVAELKSIIRNTSTGYQKQRLTALFLFRSGQATTRKQISKMIGVDRKTVGHWFVTYASEGLDALLTRNYSRVVHLTLLQNNKMYCDQNVFASIKEMQDKLTEILRKYTKTTIQNITKYDYLTKIENEI